MFYKEAQNSISTGDFQFYNREWILAGSVPIEITYFPSDVSIGFSLVLVLLLSTSSLHHIFQRRKGSYFSTVVNFR